MAEFADDNKDFRLILSEKEKFLLRISSITDLSVPPVILDQLFPILSEGSLPEDFEKSQLMHDPSMVSYFLKKLYEQNENQNALFTGIDDIFDHLTQDDMYVLLSEMSPLQQFDESEVCEWKHAYSTHLLMNQLINENGFSQLRYLVPLMLLHDIGKQVLRVLVPEESKEIARIAQLKKIPRSIAEKEILNLTHAEAGARLFQEWNFPESVYKPILYHHSNNIPEEFVLETALIQFVNWVDCNARGIPAKPLNKATMAAAGIEEIDTQYWIARHKEIVKETNAYFEPDGIMNINSIKYGTPAKTGVSNGGTTL